MKPTRLSSWLSLFIPTLLFCLLSGCADSLRLTPDDVSGRVWVAKTSHPGEVQGFFAHPDGRLLLLSDLAREGLSWEVHEGNLLVWFREPPVIASQQLQLYPVLVEDRLALTDTPGEGGRTFTPGRHSSLLDQVDYLPQVLMGRKFSAHDAENDSRAYLRFDLAGETIRGFAGVNNFRGSYRLYGGFNFEVGPIMSTRMAGPGMDREIAMMQCLEECNYLLARDKRLFLYRDGRLQCIFAAE